MIVNVSQLGQDKFRRGSPFSTGVIPGVPFLGNFHQVEEVAGGAVAASVNGQTTVTERILIGVASGLLIYVGHRLLDSLWPRK